MFINPFGSTMQRDQCPESILLELSATYFPAVALNDMLVGVRSYTSVDSWISERLMVRYMMFCEQTRKRVLVQSLSSEDRVKI